MLTALDLCCGAGGWECAARGLPIRFQAAIDWEQGCCLTTKYNHPEVPVVCGDVTRLPIGAAVRALDLVLGAIPCQEISVARNNVPLSEVALAKWHELLDGMLALIAEIKPRWWVIENVIQMRRHLPIFVPQIVLDSAHWSGQRRRRIFVGDFPIPGPGQSLTLGDYLMPGPHIVTADTLRAQELIHRQWYRSGQKRVLDPGALAPTVTSAGCRHTRGYAVRAPDGRERALSFAEAARLQGFPEDYIFVAPAGRAWKMVGQAIQIDLGRAILESIVEESKRERVA